MAILQTYDKCIWKNEQRNKNSKWDVQKGDKELSMGENIT